jgi:hypothetical protein
MRLRHGKKSVDSGTIADADLHLERTTWKFIDSTFYEGGVSQRSDIKLNLFDDCLFARGVARTPRTTGGRGLDRVAGGLVVETPAFDWRGGWAGHPAPSSRSAP